MNNRLPHDALQTKYDLWFHYADIIYKLCIKKCGNAETAKDFYQDIYIKFHLNVEKLQKHPAPFLWFRTVINNHFNSHLRKIKTKNNFYLHYEDYQTNFCSAEPLEDLLNTELSLCPMSELEKMIVDFMRIGFSCQEIADILGISIAQVSKKTHAVLNRLREGMPPLKKSS